MQRILLLILFALIKSPSAQYQASWVQLEKDSGSTGYNRIEDMFIDSVGNVFVNGAVDTLQSFSPIIISYESNGVQRWRRIVNGLNFGFNWRMLPLPNDNIICAGHYEDNSGTNNMIYVEFNSTGDSVNGGIMNAPGFSTGDDLADACLDAEGNLYMAGQIRSGNDFPAAVSSFNGASAFRWLSAFPSLPGWNSSFIRGVEMCNDTGIYCLTFNFTGLGSLLFCDTAGNFLWQRTLPISLNDYHTSLAVDVFGNAIAGGHLNQGFGLVKVNSTGDTLWSREFSYQGLSPAGGEVINVQCDSTGNIYTLGIFSGSPRYSLISKFDPSGTMIWSDTARGYSHIYGRNKDFFQIQDGIITLVTTDGLSWLYRYTLSGQRLTDQELILPGVVNPEVNSILYNNGSLYLAGNSYAGFNIRNGFTARLEDLTSFIPALNEHVSIEIYPNPVSTSLRVDFNGNISKSAEYKIFNVQGDLIVRGSLFLASNDIELIGKPEGIYLLQLVLNGKISNHKFIITK